MKLVEKLTKIKECRKIWAQLTKSRRQENRIIGIVGRCERIIFASMESENTRKRTMNDYFERSKPESPVEGQEEEPVKKSRCPMMKIFDDAPTFTEKKPTPKSAARRSGKISLRVAANDKNQRTLDAGQAVIGTVVCDKCGMVYSVDCVKDREAHEKYHNRHNDFEALKLTSRQYDSWLKNCTNSVDGNTTIFCVTEATKNGGIKKFIENIIKNQVNEATRYTYEEDAVICGKSRLIYVCVQNEKDERPKRIFVAGVLVVDKLESASIEDSSQDFEIPTEKCGKDEDYIVGVDRIWTAESERRKGIAKTMLNAAVWRDKSMKMNEDPRRVAFDDLTDSGEQFARHFVKNNYQSDHLLVYSESDIMK